MEYLSHGAVSCFLDMTVFAGLSTCHFVLLISIDVNLVASLLCVKGPCFVVGIFFFFYCCCFGFDVLLFWLLGFF